MGYSTVKDVENIIAQGLTNATPVDPTNKARVPLLAIGKTFNYNLAPQSVIEQYIQWADEQVNAALSTIYVTPFREKSDFESKLYANIDVYNNYVVICQTCPLTVNDVIILTDGTNTEKHIIDEVVDDVENRVFSTLEPVMAMFDADETRVARVKYPETIKLISAMLAASRIYDKYYSAQNDPNTSEYGKHIYNQALGMLNEIRQGGTILHGQERRGYRFYNPNLNGAHGLPFGGEGDKRLQGPGG